MHITTTIYLHGPYTGAIFFFFFFFFFFFNTRISSFGKPVLLSCPSLSRGGSAALLVDDPELRQLSVSPGFPSPYVGTLTGDCPFE